MCKKRKAAQLKNFSYTSSILSKYLLKQRTKKEKKEKQPNYKIVSNYQEANDKWAKNLVRGL